MVCARWLTAPAQGVRAQRGAGRRTERTSAGDRDRERAALHAGHGRLDDWKIDSKELLATSWESPEPQPRQCPAFAFFPPNLGDQPRARSARRMHAEVRPNAQVSARQRPVAQSQCGIRTPARFAQHALYVCHLHGYALPPGARTQHEALRGSSHAISQTSKGSLTQCRNRSTDCSRALINCFATSRKCDKYFLHGDHYERDAEELHFGNYTRAHLTVVERPTRCPHL